MHIEKKQAMLMLLAAWVVVIIVFMSLSYVVDLEILFVLWLIGLLVIVELADSMNIRPQYMKSVKIVVAIGVFVFATIVALKVMEILAK